MGLILGSTFLLPSLDLKMKYREKIVNPHKIISAIPRKVKNSRKVNPDPSPMIMLLTEPIRVLVPPKLIIIAADKKYGTGS